MSDNSYDLKAAYKTVKLLFMGIAIGPIIFLFISLYITEEVMVKSFDLSEPLNIALIIITLTTVPVGNIIARRTFSEIKPESDTRERMAVFQRAMIITLATYEAVELFSIVVFMVTGNIVVLLFTAIGFLGILRNFPSIGKISSSAGIDITELM